MGMRKTLRETFKAIELEGQRIRTEYAYMDNMQKERNLDGWIWEFVRRGREYQEAFEDFQHFVSLNPHRTKIDILDDRWFNQDNDFWDQFRNITSTGVFWPAITHEPLNPDLYFIYDDGDKDVNSGFPRPDRKFCDFDNNPKPIVHRKCVHYQKGETMLLHAKADILFLVKRIFSELEKAKKERLSKKSLGDNIDRWIYRALNIYERKFGKGVVITVDTQRGKDEIKAELNSIIDAVVPRSGTKRRDDKWKYYLIVYDLKKTGLNYPEISLILSESFAEEKNLLDAKNVENYWKQAHFLIDEKQYKDFV
jgi:hypothetical protein